MQQMILNERKKSIAILRGPCLIREAELNKFTSVNIHPLHRHYSPFKTLVIMEFISI